MLKRPRSRLLGGSRNKPNTPKTHNTSDVQEGRFKYQHAQQQHDRYQTLAREALTTGDRVLAEGYYQQAEHFLRLMSGLKAESAAKPTAPELTVVKNNDEGDIEEVMNQHFA